MIRSWCVEMVILGFCSTILLIFHCSIRLIKLLQITLVESICNHLQSLWSDLECNDLEDLCRDFPFLVQIFGAGVFGVTFLSLVRISGYDVFGASIT